MNRAERLKIASRVAPVVRDAARSGRGRRIKVVDADGRVVRELDTAELHERVLARAGIEFDVVEGRPDYRICPCGKAFRVVQGAGLTLVACPACRSQAVCAGSSRGACPHNAVPPRGAFTARSMQLRGSQPWQCASCAAVDRPRPTCPRGHEISGDNVRIARQKAGPYATCLTCARARDREKSRRRRARRSASEAMETFRE